MSSSKLCHFLLQGLASKNKRSRVVCLEEIQRIVESDPKGAAALGRAGVREVAVYLDSKDNDVSGRQACLDLCYALYLAPPILGDLPKLTKLLVGTHKHMCTDSLMQAALKSIRMHQHVPSPCTHMTSITILVLTLTYNIHVSPTPHLQLLARATCPSVLPRWWKIACDKRTNNSSNKPPDKG